MLPPAPRTAARLAVLASLAAAPAAQAATVPLHPSQSREAAAVRFLNRATFGATPADTAFVANQGYEAWLDAQMLVPPSLMLDDLVALGCAPDQPGESVVTCPGYEAEDHFDLRNRLWWRHALAAPDQLRQRVAFALSEILVVSDRPDGVGFFTSTVGDYYDVLVTGALGNYRDLLEEVTLHPSMGTFLSMAQNRKADPVAGTRPDENFAREVMQLFSIGLVQLDAQGRVRKDLLGNPIPTYDQDVIEETARALTGWTYASPHYGPSASLELFQLTYPHHGRMVAWPTFHDTGAKTIVGGVTVPAGQTPEEDLALVLDTLANHPNTGPFVSKQLIQRLVTSNPSPEYVGRVAAVWAHDGTGERGDLAAVVRAILLDREAQAGHRLRPRTFGKLREPLLRVTGLWRAFGTDDAETYLWTIADQALGQRAQGAPSVFNFFSPSYATATLAAEDLVAPELQIVTTSTVTSTANVLTGLIYVGNSSLVDASWTEPVLDVELLRLLTANVPGFVDLLDLRLCGGTMARETREALNQYLAAIPYVVPGWPVGIFRALEGLGLVALSPDYAVQR